MASPLAPAPSKAVLSAIQRRAAKAGAKAANIQWFINDVVAITDLSVKERVSLATDFISTKVVSNISRPVTRTKGQRGRDKETGEFTSAPRTKITDRSKPGEYPKTDTGQLLRTIFTVKRLEGKVWVGYVGTPLDYGLILEVVSRLDRSYLVRTLNENRETIYRILTTPLSSLEIQKASPQAISNALRGLGDK